MASDLNIVITIGARDAQRDAYYVQLQSERTPLAGIWAKIDCQALLEDEHRFKPHDYGMELYDTLFTGALGRSYQRLIGQAGVENAIRVQLVIHPDAPELHALPWERLFHIYRGGETPLAADAQTPFSRFLVSGAGEQLPVTEQSLRLLVAIANPSNLPKDCSPLDVEGEVTSLADFLVGYSNRIQGTLLAGRSGLPDALRLRLTEQGWTLHDGVTSWKAIRRWLPGHHILHVLALGQFRVGDVPGKGTAYLLLEHEGSENKTRGSLDRVPDDDIVTTLAGVAPLPQLIFLAACDTAKRPMTNEGVTSGSNPFVGLAPKLIEAGVPAIVAMQDKVPTDLARRLATDFYRRLFDHGLVDRALNEARGLAYERDQFEWAIPVLFLRLKNGRLFTESKPQIPPRTAGPLRVYICRVGEDIVAIESLHRDLASRGMELLLPHTDPRVQETAFEIKRADVVLVYLSPNASDAPGHLRAELQEVIQKVEESNGADERVLPIVPVLIYDTPLPGALSKWNPIHLDMPEGLNQLISLLTGLAEEVGADKPKQLAVQLPLSQRELPNPLVIESPIRLQSVLVPACVHWMGSKEDVEFENERPCCTVPLNDYYISKYPITVEQFGVFAAATGYKTTAEEQGYGRDWAKNHTDWVDIPGGTWHHPYGPNQPAAPRNHPVTQVSWYDAVGFCKWLTQACGKQVSLPSEAEWDRAAHGPKIRTYPWGERAPDPSLCNFNKTIDGTTEVGRYSPLGDSYYGCADMAGNVWEWTRSLYKSYPYDANDGREDMDSPEARALRGGSYHGGAERIRNSVRDVDPPTKMLTAAGFRVMIVP